MGKLTFIAGGARSGKSSYAVKLAKRLGKKVAFIATATATDEEMSQRIKKHKASRPRSWKIIEEAKNVTPKLSKLKKHYDVIIIDCLGLLVSNLLEDGLRDTQILGNIKKITALAASTDSRVIIVSNEVGDGIVPANKVARRFRDLVGSSNQIIAKKADEAILMRFGIPFTLKGEKNETA